jgi:hypothetical protein
MVGTSHPTTQLSLSVAARSADFPQDLDVLIVQDGFRLTYCTSSPCRVLPALPG